MQCKTLTIKLIEYMSKKIDLVEDLTKVAYFFETEDGKKLKLPYYFCNRVDLDNLVVYGEDETDEFPMVDELIKAKRLKCCFTYDIVEKQYKIFNDNISIPKLQEFFRKHGYNVTEDAIKHNLDNYMLNCKSGYRDEANGYHLFTPCRANYLTFRLTSLNDNCQDWQTTYGMFS